MEKKQEITEEQVKEYQMLLAQWMQLPKDALEILNEDMPWRIGNGCMYVPGSDIRGRITSNETTRAEKDPGYPGEVSQTEVSGSAGNPNPDERIAKADGRRGRETGNCFVQTTGGSVTDSAVSGARKTKLKGAGRASGWKNGENTRNNSSRWK
mgnify:CR=1 FL=1